jgi:hypothetical protein
MEMKGLGQSNWNEKINEIKYLVAVIPETDNSSEK